MRMLATSVEARATDTNEYPKVSFEDLPPLIRMLRRLLFRQIFLRRLVRFVR